MTIEEILAREERTMGRRCHLLNAHTYDVPTGPPFARTARKTLTLVVYEVEGIDTGDGQSHVQVRHVVDVDGKPSSSGIASDWFEDSGKPRA